VTVANILFTPIVTQNIFNNYKTNSKFFAPYCEPQAATDGGLRGINVSFEREIAGSVA
jgi:hypothetical protein